MRNRKLRLLILAVVMTACAVMLAACNPVLTLKPEYAYSDFELNLGEKVPTEIEDYIDFSELNSEETEFVKNNTEILLDGREVKKGETVKTGSHTVTIRYCGTQYRNYNIEIVDTEPPVFTKSNDIYTFIGLGVNEDTIDLMFEAEDNSGECKVKVNKSEVDVSKTGEYEMKATAIDPSGNKSYATARIVVQKPHYGANGTYVYVSIDNQHLTYFVDGKVALSTDVVTGNIYGHNTPTGTYRVNSKGRNVTLKGRESNGDEYESFVNYWMAFIGSSYGLHDASWRSSFGGEIYKGGGSHGCVNMPIPMAGKLYDMIEVGTPVLVY